MKCQEAISEHLDEQYGSLLGNTNSASACRDAPHVCAVHFWEPPILSRRQGVLAAARRPAPPAAAARAPPFSADARCPAGGERLRAADPGQSAGQGRRSEPRRADKQHRLAQMRLTPAPTLACCAAGGPAGRGGVAWFRPAPRVPPVPGSVCPRAAARQSGAPVCAPSAPTRVDGRV